MNRDQKATAVAEIGEELDAATAVFAVDYRGISVPQAAELRVRLQDADASFSVVKNRLAKRATESTGSADLDEFLVGPTALTFVRGDAVLAAKEISDFIKKNGVLAYKGGIMDGSALSPDEFTSIARLPGVEVLRGQLVGLIASPLSGVVRTLNQLIGGLASQLGQIADQGLVSGEAPEPAAADEPAAESAPAEDGDGGDSKEPADDAVEEEDAAETGTEEAPPEDPPAGETASEPADAEADASSELPAAEGGESGGDPDPDDAEIAGPMGTESTEGAPDAEPAETDDAETTSEDDTQTEED
jgi:large subunit ribosomal protein L10